MTNRWQTGIPSRLMLKSTFPSQRESLSCNTSPQLWIDVNDINGIIYRVKDPQPEEDLSVQARNTRLQEQYQESGIRRSVDAVIVVHVRSIISMRQEKGESSTDALLSRNTEHLIS